VEQLDEVVESVAVGQEWSGDTRIVLFVHLRPGLQLDAQLESRIRRALRDKASPRHVPAKILQVADIPRTMNGKIAELAVRETLHGREIANRGALVNPESLEYFENLGELRG
ncbi:MAG TPA: acetoacetate--CoA ligase, partial [Gammaproteobacteria bacterium]|nr:acetoacetate--CoA ligase [Gammaproteobacteria bacterium]